jgi:hypothetical protein
MSRPTNSTPRLLTSAALVVGLSVSWSLPSVALAAPPELPAEQPASEPAPAAEPVAVQPAPAAEPQPAPQPGWEQPQPAPTAAPATQPQPQPQPPPPAYQPMPQPQPAPPPAPNPNRGLGLMIAGFSVFGVSYLITAVTGTASIDAGYPEIGRPLLIPVAGPFIAGARQSQATIGLGLGIVGVVQLAGLGMGVGGAVMFGSARRRARLSAAPGGFQLQF